MKGKFSGLKRFFMLTYLSGVVFLANASTSLAVIQQPGVKGKGKGWFNDIFEVIKTIFGVLIEGAFWIGAFIVLAGVIAIATGVIKKGTDFYDTAIHMIIGGAIYCLAKLILEFVIGAIW